MWPFYRKDEERQVPLNDTTDANAATERTRLTSTPHHDDAGRPRSAPSSVTVQVEVPLDKDFLLDMNAGPNATYGSAVSRLDETSKDVLEAAASQQEQPFTLLLRHDSEFSVGSAYQNQTTVGARAAAALIDDSKEGGVTETATPDLPPPLNVWQGALLLTADCLGTGLLALPGDVKVLGYFVGLGFLILNGPINFYAGTILAGAATTVERRQRAANRIFETALRQVQQQQSWSSTAQISSNPTPQTPHNTLNARSSTQPNNNNNHDNTFINAGDTSKSITSVITIESALLTTTNNSTTTNNNPTVAHTHLHHDTATFDFIGMTQAIFQKPAWTRFIMALYYTNIFLVLGNYILVMSEYLQ